MKGEAFTRFTAVTNVVDKMADWNNQRGDLLAHEAERTYLNARSLSIGIVATAALLSIVIAWFITSQVTGPLKLVVNAAKNLALGDINQEITLVRKDEIGDVAEALRNLISYQQEMAGVASEVAAGDLTRSIQPKSAKDTLGNAFTTMITNLRSLIGQVAQSAEAVASTSTQLIDCRPSRPARPPRTSPAPCRKWPPPPISPPPRARRWQAAASSRPARLRKPPARWNICTPPFGRCRRAASSSRPPCSRPTKACSRRQKRSRKSLAPPSRWP